jgi:uncharacterized protein YodC (DUF2158 family)
VADEGFRVGDRVMLKAGGPVMTVRALSLSLAYCAWTEADGSAHSGTFELASLAAVREAPRQPEAGSGPRNSGGADRTP